MKLITPLLDFWKKDIINKLIVVVLLGLIGGALVVGWLIFSVPQAGKSLGDAFSDLIPVRATPTFDINSYLTPNANIPVVPAATEVFVSVPTFTPYVVPSLEPTLEQPPTAIIELPTSTPEVIVPVLPTQQVQPTVAALPASAESACVPNNPPKTGKVVEILDGNTVRVLIDKLIYVVRYTGVTAPENAPYSDAAKAENSKLVYGKAITLIQDKTDKDDRGRLLRYVWIDSAFVNLELIKLGFASAANGPDSSCAQTFQQAEQAAKTALAGMWAPLPTKKSP